MPTIIVRPQPTPIFHNLAICLQKNADRRAGRRIAPQRPSDLPAYRWAQNTMNRIFILQTSQQEIATLQDCMRYSTIPLNHGEAGHTLQIRACGSQPTTNRIMTHEATAQLRNLAPGHHLGASHVTIMTPLSSRDAVHILLDLKAKDTRTGQFLSWLGR